MTAVRADARADQVLDAVEARFGRSGTRALVMSDLARELRMSTKTLYRMFHSKDALVSAVITRWSAQLAGAQERRTRSDMSSEERVRTAAHFLIARRSRFCDEFWDDLRADHPDAWAQYTAMTNAARERSAEWTARALRPGLDATFARALLVAGIERALQPEVRAAAGLSRSQAIDAAVAIWARGAFTEPDAPPPPAH